MHHETIHFDVVGNTLYLQAVISYVVANDPENLDITIPAFAVFVFNEETGYLDRAQIFLDGSPVFARVGIVGSAAASDA
ncbi:hypothetical protein PVAG01_08402 [Phlyctema vagabunda]|uniref:Uncharacterized protein n=1 Tax=Phlyctema vagabunda TaxID=108571 RepID=A0ABR4P9C4_9HELO